MRMLGKVSCSTAAGLLLVFAPVLLLVFAPVLFLALPRGLLAQSGSLPASANFTDAQPGTTPASPELGNTLPPAEAPSASGPVLKQNPLTALREFQPDADEQYRLGRGDEITVDFAGRPELEAKLVIGPDGRITLPLAGELVLNGLTRAQAAHSIEVALATYYQNLSAQVTVTKYTANKVLVLGAVEHPGVVSFDDQPTLLEALTRAGTNPGPAKANATLPERCAIYRGQDKVVWVEVKKLVETGSSLADLRLRRDDVIYVPSAAENFVSVLGEVGHPGAVPLSSSSTLASVIAQSGGFTAKAGHTPHIQIVDPATGVSRTVTMAEMLNPVRSLEITLKAGQILYVPQSGFNRATYVLERLNPLITASSFAVFAGGVL